MNHPIKCIPAACVLLALTIHTGMAQSTAARTKSMRTPIEMLSNGSFVKSASNWTLEQTAPAKGQMSVVTDGPNGQHALRLLVRSVSDHQWHLQIYQNGLRLHKDAAYVLSFWAKSDRAGEIKVNCQQNHEPWEHHEIALPVSLSPAWKQIRYAFVGPYDDSDMRLQFTDLGVQVNQVYWFAGCSLMENPKAPKVSDDAKPVFRVSSFTGKFDWYKVGVLPSAAAHQFRTAKEIVFDVTFKHDVVLTRDEHGNRWFTFDIADQGPDMKWHEPGAAVDLPVKDGVIKAGKYTVSVPIGAIPVTVLQEKEQSFSVGPHASGLMEPIDFSIEGWRSK